MNITDKIVLEALSHVDDPDLKKDLVTLGMIKNLSINDNKIAFTVELTTPACPMKEAIKGACLNAIKLMVSKDAEVEITMSSKVTSHRKEGDNILPGVKNIIVVVSGKGGVGKSTVATNLALGLGKMNAKVGILDADIYGPSLPIMMGLQGQKPPMVSIAGKHMISPIEKYGIKSMSIGLLVDDKQAVVWRGPMVSSALRQFITDVYWGELDYLIIDMPPGTGDVHLTLVQTVPVTGAIVVTTPQDVALADANKAVSMFSMGQIKVPVLGVVENMAYFTPAELPENIYYIFGKDGGQKLADEFNIPLLGQIPIVQSIREGGDCGVPAVLADEPIIKKAFENLASTIAQQIAIRNAQLSPTKIVEMIK
jgi:ATP-binding protein involved in chromosome partitioning